jgi:hypothetical protein
LFEREQIAIIARQQVPSFTGFSISGQEAQFRNPGLEILNFEQMDIRTFGSKLDQKENEAKRQRDRE